MSEPQERADPFGEFIGEILGPNKVDQDFARDIQSSEVKDYIKINNLNLEAVRRWYNKPHEIFEAHGSDFDKFTEGCRELVKRGDEIMMSVESTGFNIDRYDIFTEDDFGQNNDEPAVYYNCSIEKPMHFALLLADMERLGLIRADDRIGYYCKGTKVNWKWGDQNSENTAQKVIRSDGTAVAVKATMETVLKFHLSWDRVPEILDYLEGHVFNKRKGRIPDSFDDPDIRILPDFISSQTDQEVGDPVTSEIKGVFMPAIMNEYVSVNGKLMVLRQKTSFSDNVAMSDWGSRKIVLNKELYNYIVSDDVRP